jgi:hypothetical protein
MAAEQGLVAMCADANKLARFELDSKSESDSLGTNELRALPLNFSARPSQITLLRCLYLDSAIKPQ